LSQLFLVVLWLGMLVSGGGCTDTNRTEDHAAQSTPSTPIYGGVYRKALGNEPVTLDPALITSTYATAVAQQLFDGLVQFDADLNVIPSIANSWSASHDGLTWTFHLRQGVRFHHGREVTANDFVYTFTRILDPHTQSPYTSIFERVQGAQAFMATASDRVTGLQALDPYTLRITLSQPYAPFISMLGIVQASVVPRDEVARLGKQFSQQPVGTGPFRFERWMAGQDIVLQANPTYFEGRPFLDRIHYRIFTPADSRAILAEFEQGHLEDASIPAQERQRLRSDARYRFFRKPLLATLFLWIDTKGSPLSHVKVRQAINYGINRRVINDEIRQNGSVEARGILPPGMPGYNPELAGYQYDPERAQHLLVEAGYPQSQGLPTVELWTSVGSPTVLAEHEAIQHDLQRLGISVVLRKAESWRQYTELLGKRPGSMFRYAWFADFPDPDNFLFTLFHSQSPNNVGNYQNPEVDRLLELARRENDYFQRLQIYRQAEALIMADAPTVNLVYATFEHLFQPYVRGIALNALGERYIPMKKIWLDTPHHVPSNLAQSK
jgi:peptide/nickel transport system substrate-binding protein/oligopeptide transport system substrate-binding protein